VWTLNDAMKEGIPWRIPSLVIMLKSPVGKPFSAKFKVQTTVAYLINFLRLPIRERPPLPLPPVSDDDSDDSDNPSGPSGPPRPPIINKEELLSSEEDGNSSRADETSSEVDETSLRDETGSRVSVELGSEVDTSSEAKDLDSETGSEVVESKSKVDTSFEASSKDLDLADGDLDLADKDLDLVDEDLDSKVSLDSEKSLDFDKGGYWSGSDDD